MEKHVQAIKDPSRLEVNLNLIVKNEAVPIL